MGDNLTKAEDKGFLASLTNKKAYFLRKDLQNAKLFTIYAEHMDIGNADLRFYLNYLNAT